MWCGVGRVYWYILPRSCTVPYSPHRQKLKSPYITLHPRTLNPFPKKFQKPRFKISISEIRRLKNPLLVRFSFSPATQHPYCPPQFEPSYPRRDNQTSTTQPPWWTLHIIIVINYTANDYQNTIHTQCSTNICVHSSTPHPPCRKLLRVTIHDHT